MTRWALHDDGMHAILHAVGQAVRWDVCVERSLPEYAGSRRVRTRLAHQVRQDVWRTLQRVRGFAPLVAITAQPDGVTIRCGGSLLAKSGHRGVIEHRLEDVLDDRFNRRRWFSHAVRGAASPGRK